MMPASGVASLKPFAIGRVNLNIGNIPTATDIICQCAIAASKNLLFTSGQPLPLAEKECFQWHGGNGGVKRNHLHHGIYPFSSVYGQCGISVGNDADVQLEIHQGFCALMESEPTARIFSGDLGRCQIKTRRSTRHRVQTAV